MAIQKDIYNIQLKWATRVVALAKANLIRGKKIATGRLYSSVNFSITPKAKVTFTYAGEGKWVERGRRKGSKMPPIDVIKEWGSIKKLPQFRDKKGRYISNDSRAFLIARSISKKGIEPFPWITSAMKQATQQLKPKQSIADAVRKGLRSMLKPT